MPTPYRFTEVSEGHATVLDRETGKKLGRVHYREKSWNLRRYYVSRWWDAITPEGHTIDTPSKRGEAAEALVVHSRRPPAVQRVYEAAQILCKADAFDRSAREIAAYKLLVKAQALGANVDVHGELSSIKLFEWCRALEID